MALEHSQVSVYKVGASKVNVTRRDQLLSCAETHDTGTQTALKPQATDESSSPAGHLAAFRVSPYPRCVSLGQLLREWEHGRLWKSRGSASQSHTLPLTGL